jgi:hypothetical protein
MSVCYWCGKEITRENASEEHIIPNSIGGHLKSRKLLCIKCNNKFGENIDFELSKQFQFFTIYLAINRERGKPPAFLFDEIDDGDNYILESNGKIKLKHPNFKETKEGNVVKYKIRTNTSKELNEIVEKLQKKNAGEMSVISRGTDNKPIDLGRELHFDPKIFPAILKIAISMYIEKTNDLESIKDAINDLKNNIGSKVDHIIFDNDLIEPDDKEISHFIFIKGSKIEKKLYAIIELFNFKQFIIKLSGNYDNNDIEYLYIYDIVKRKEVFHKITNVPSYNYIFNYDYTKASHDFSIVERKISRIMTIGLENHNFIELKETANEVYKEYFRSQNNEIQLFLEQNEILVKEEIKRLYFKKINGDSDIDGNTL